MTRSIVRLPEPRQTPYGVLRAAPFQGDPALPAESEVIIIGGGICGIFAAYHLAKRNIPVLVIEKAEIGCEASSRAFGWVSELLLDPIKMPMSAESKRLWREFQAEGGEAGFRQHGLAMFAESDEELDFFRGWLDSVSGAADSGNAILTPGQVAERYPTASRRFAGALFAPSDGSAEPIIATAAIAEAARKAGARIVTDCAVRGLDLKAGQVAGVFTEKGYVKASTVVCAANAWSRIFCGNHGVDVPQIYLIMTTGRSGVTEGPVAAGAANGAGWREMIDGSYSLGGQFSITAPVTRDALKLASKFRPLMQAEMGSAKPDFGRAAWDDLRLKRRWKPDGVSPFETHRVLCGRPAKGYAETSLKLNSEIFPEMAGAGVRENWSGAITLTPDNMPIAGPVDAIPGFHVMTGVSYGISWSPSISKMMADLITGAQTSIDPQLFRLSRFSDGSPLVVRH